MAEEGSMHSVACMDWYRIQEECVRVRQSYEPRPLTTLILYVSAALDAYTNPSSSSVCMIRSG